MTSMHTAMFGGWNEGQEDQHWFPRREGGPKLIMFESPRWRPKSSSSLPRCPGPACTKNDAKAAYRVRFGRSLYGWKDNFKDLPMTLVSDPNSLGVDRNRRNKGTPRICHGVVTSSFGLLAHVSCWGPLWMWLGGYACPQHSYIRVWVLFISSFPRETEIDSLQLWRQILFSNPGPPFMISSSVSISPFEPSD